MSLNLDLNQDKYQNGHATQAYDLMIWKWEQSGADFHFSVRTVVILEWSICKLCHYCLSHHF